MSLTKREAAVISAYTGYLIGRFGDMAEYVEEKLGRPVFTNEYPRLADQIREAAKPDFLAIEVLK